MDELLIDIWNKFVKPNDLVYHLGDFTLSGRDNTKRLFLRLNGRIHILGNPWHHDKQWLNNGLEYFSSDGAIIIEPPVLVLENIEQFNRRGIPAILCHYAFARWDRRHYGSYHFFGHSHSKYNPGGRSLDVGVDSAYILLGEYRPFTLQEAIVIAKLNGGNIDDEKNLDG